MGGTRGSGVLSSACDVFEMSVGGGVGGVCDMCMSLARDGVGCVGGLGQVMGGWVVVNFGVCCYSGLFVLIIDICFLTCICLWQISQIQTCLHVFLGPGSVSTSVVVVRLSAHVHFILGLSPISLTVSL